MIEQLMKDFLRLNITISGWNGRKNFRCICLTTGSFYIARMGELCFLIVSMAENEKYGVRELKIQRQRLQEISQMPVVFCFSSIGRVQRDALIRARISFLALPDQAYLPDIGILIQNKRGHAAIVTPEKLSVPAQELFLFMLYRMRDQEIPKTKAAEKIGLGLSAMTRASQELEQLKLIRSDKRGKEIYISAAATGYEYYEMAKGFLFNPVMRTATISKDSVPQIAVTAGESVVAALSDLAAPPVKTYAVFKKDAVPDIQLLDEKWQNDEDYAKLEFWKYDPRIFATRNGADVVSVTCSLGEIFDERLEYAVSEMLKENLK